MRLNQAMGVGSALLGRVLAGSWRRNLPPLDLDFQTLPEISHLLSQGGVGALVWRRIRGTDLGASSLGARLQEIHRHYAIRNALHMHHLKASLLVLREIGIESVLVKGWSLAGLYPEPGLRPFGDIDLCVRPAEYEVAAGALRGLRESGAGVDLHAGFGKFYDRRTDELFARSRLVELDDVAVRVLRSEDHLRFLCLHLLRHGGGRPLWLCDIGAALEQLPADFDWKLCLGDHQPQADWVVGTIWLAHELLGVNIQGTPLAQRPKPLPRWLLSTMLSEWGSPFEFPGQTAAYLRRPKDLLRELPRHWPNPIEATVNLRGRLSRWPRLPFQIGAAIGKAARFLAGTRGLMRAR